MAIKPNFLIVGAAKSGTTSLYEYLRHHAEVFMPDWKEPSHFVPEAGGIADWDAYLVLFEGAEGYERVGEASVSYLMHPEAPAKIAARLGTEIKIVVLLRNPVDMAHSNWGHQVREGYETLDFLDALKDEPRRLSDPTFRASCRKWPSDLTYIARVRYAAQVERYVATFGRTNVAIYLFEEFFAPGLPLFADLCRFLGIDDGYVPAARAYNKAGTVRSAYVRRILTERMEWKEPLKRVLPAALRGSAMRLLARVNRVDQELPEIPKEAADIIRDATRADVVALGNLLGTDVAEIWGYQYQDA